MHRLIACLIVRQFAPFPHGATLCYGLNSGRALLLRVRAHLVWRTETATARRPPTNRSTRPIGVGQSDLPRYGWCPRSSGSRRRSPFLGIPLPVNCLSTAFPLPYHCIFTAVPPSFQCFPPPFHRLSTAIPLPYHRLSLTFHCGGQGPDNSLLKANMTHPTSAQVRGDFSCCAAREGGVSENSLKRSKRSKTL